MIKMMMLKHFIFSCLFLAMPALSVELLEDDAERLLKKSISFSKEGNWQQANSLANTLIKQYPKFKAGQHWLSLLEQKTTIQPTTAPHIKHWTNEYTAANLEAELHYRYSSSQFIANPALKPKSIIQLSEQFKHAIIIETKSSRAYLFKNTAGQAEYLDDFYIAIGKSGIGSQLLGKEKEGDHKTPVGVYMINGFLADKQIGEIFGAGALTLNYPNHYDKKLKRTGHSIWLHGVPRNTYSRPPHSTRGCIAMSNSLFTQLKDIVGEQKVPVVITDKIEWVNKDSNHQLLASVEQWKNDWESQNVSTYALNYHADFLSSSQRKKWLKRKNLVNANKKFIEVNVKGLSLFNYPQHEGLVASYFQQHYSSSNYNSQSSKVIYWKKEKGNYKILIEKTL